MERHPSASVDPLEIAVFFEDRKINLLISGLLNARGVRTRIITSTEDLSAMDKVITEPQYFPRLGARSRKHCLLIGNREAVEGANAITLTRPLTEEKIEQAMAEFLDD